MRWQEWKWRRKGGTHRESLRPSSLQRSQTHSFVAQVDNALLPQGEQLLAGAMDEWYPSKYAGNFGTSYTPTRRQSRANKLPL